MNYIIKLYLMCKILAIILNDNLITLVIYGPCRHFKNNKIAKLKSSGSTLKIPTTFHSHQTLLASPSKSILHIITSCHLIYDNPCPITLGLSRSSLLSESLLGS